MSAFTTFLITVMQGADKWTSFPSLNSFKRHFNVLNTFDDFKDKSVDKEQNKFCCRVSVCPWVPEKHISSNKTSHSGAFKEPFQFVWFFRKPSIYWHYKEPWRDSLFNRQHSRQIQQLFPQHHYHPILSDTHAAHPLLAQRALTGLCSGAMGG